MDKGKDNRYIQVTNKGKKYKDRQNDKRRIVYWLERHGLGWVAKLVKKIKT